MLKKILFRLHWILGLSAGLVLALMGLTGASLSFEDEILVLLNPAIRQVVPQGDTVPSPPELQRRIQSVFPERRIAGLYWSAEPRDAARVAFAAESTPGARKPGRPRLSWQFVDPYDGRLLGTEDDQRGHATLHFLEDLHRKLALGDTGKAVTGFAALVLVFMALSGLYLRWPRRLQAWRSLFRINWRLRGRPFVWNLHGVAGTWLMLLFLTSALTGLFWSYDWYKDAVFKLTGTPKPSREAPRLEAPATGPLALDAVWAAFGREAGAVRIATVIWPAKADEAVEVRYLAADAPHDRAFGRVVLHPVTAAVLLHEAYARKPAGGQLVSSLFSLHSGSFFGLPGRLLMMLAALAMPGFALTGWMLYLGRRRVTGNSIRLGDAIRGAASLPD